jgi:hypothetical protein
MGNGDPFPEGRRDKVLAVDQAGQDHLFVRDVFVLGQNVEKLLDGVDFVLGLEVVDDVAGLEVIGKVRNP